MKTRFIHLNRSEIFNLDYPVEIRDKYGTPWKVSRFRVDGFTGHVSVNIKYYGEYKLPLFEARKKLYFNSDGKLYLKVCNKVFCVGTWEVKDI